MDIVDFSIFRYMFPNGEGRFWGARSVVDPRISPREIGERIGLSEVAVRQRIAKLRAEGFLLGHEVWPNPRLFGASLRVVELSAKDTEHADQILAGLRRIDGVVSAREMIDESERRVRVSFVEDTFGPTRLRLEQIVKLGSVDGSATSLPEWIPLCPRAMTPLDWRIVSELRKTPEIGLGAHARRVGISPKRFSRRFNELLDSHSIFWTLKVNNSLLAVAAFWVWLSDASARNSVYREIEARVGSWLPTAPGGLGEPPHPPAPWIAAMFWVRAPADTETLTRLLRKIPGIRSVQRRFPSTAISVPTWFDRQIEGQLAQPRTLETTARVRSIFNE